MPKIFRSNPALPGFKNCISLDPPPKGGPQPAVGSITGAGWLDPPGVGGAWLKNFPGQNAFRADKVIHPSAFAGRNHWAGMVRTCLAGLDLSASAPGYGVGWGGHDPHSGTPSNPERKILGLRWATSAAERPQRTMASITRCSRAKGPWNEGGQRHRTPPRRRLPKPPCVPTSFVTTLLRLRMVPRTRSAHRKLVLFNDMNLKLGQKKAGITGLVRLVWLGGIHV